MAGEVTLRRIDNDLSVSLSYDPSVIPEDHRLKPLMQKVLLEKASEQEKALFKELWQERVKKILLTQAFRNKMIQIH